MFKFIFSETVYSLDEKPSCVLASGRNRHFIFSWYLSFSSQLCADIVGKPHETCFGFFGGTLSEFYGLGIFGGLSAGLMFCCLFGV